MQAAPTNLFTNVSLEKTPPQDNQKNQMKNPALSFSVITPPDKLPKTSLYKQVYETDTFSQSPKDLPSPKPLKPQGEKSSSGAFAMKMTFLSAFLAGVALLPFVRKH